MSTRGKENEKRPRASTEIKQKEVNIIAQHDELVITEILGASATIPGPVQITPKTVPPAHPHFGAKQPKQHRPPPKCISVICKEEKEELMEKLADTHKELADTLEELSKCRITIN